MAQSNNPDATPLPVHNCRHNRREANGMAMGVFAISTPILSGVYLWLGLSLWEIGELILLLILPTMLSTLLVNTAYWEVKAYVRARHLE